MSSDKRLHESMAQSRTSGPISGIQDNSDSNLYFAESHDLQEMASRFDTDEEIVVVADKKIYVQANNGKKALDDFHKNWQAQGFGNSNKRFNITVVEDADAEEVGINTPENTKKPGNIAQGSAVSEKPGTSTKREED